MVSQMVKKLFTMVAKFGILNCYDFRTDGHGYIDSSRCADQERLFRIVTNILPKRIGLFSLVLREIGLKKSILFRLILRPSQTQDLAIRLKFWDILFSIKTLQ